MSFFTGLTVWSPREKIYNSLSMTISLQRSTIISDDNLRSREEGTREKRGVRFSIWVTTVSKVKIFSSENFIFERTKNLQKSIQKFPCKYPVWFMDTRHTPGAPVVKRRGTNIHGDWVTCSRESVKYRKER